MFLIPNQIITILKTTIKILKNLDKKLDDLQNDRDKKKKKNMLFKHCKYIFFLKLIKFRYFNFNKIVQTVVFRYSKMLFCYHKILKSKGNLLDFSKITKFEIDFSSSKNPSKITNNYPFSKSVAVLES